VGSLSYEYGRGQVWIGPLTAERDPHAYDLCERHVATLGVPLGWTLTDRRDPRFCRLESTGTEPF
jgi:hypothetical protein